MQEGKKSHYSPRFTGGLKPHTSPLRTQTCSPWLETLQGSANWPLSKHPAARAAWEPLCDALISRAACVVIPPRESPSASKWKNSLLCMVSACLAQSKAAVAAGFLYLHLKCHNSSPPRGKGKTY